MKNVNKKFLIFFSILFFSISNYLNAVEFRGAGVETYKGSSSKKKINEALAVATDKACKNAFKKYLQGMEESKRTIFISIEDKIE